MKTVKIRFIEYSGKKEFTIQRKVWYGWKDIMYFSGACAGGGTYYCYTKSDKESLIEVVLENYYKTCKKFVSVIEYPTIKKY